MRHIHLRPTVQTWYVLLYTCMFILLSAFSVQAQNKAAFTADNPTGCGTAAVNFTDQSTPKGVAYSWNFGDGKAGSSLINPSRLFTTPGTYTVTLTVTFADGSKGTATSTVNVYKIPTGNITANVTSGCTPLAVTFTDKSTPGDGTITSVNWDFGDGNAATGATANYTYNVGGSYDASVIVTNSFGCTSSQSVTITPEATPEPEFTSNTQGSCKAPLTVNFTNQTTVKTTGNPSVSYAWDFGDGATSTDLNPIHTYTAEGKYTVKLTASSLNGCKKTITKTDYIQIATIAADFTIADKLCKGSTLHFTNTTKPVPASATWTFSDGTTQNSIDAVKTFNTPGTYTVTLSCLTSDGCQANTTRTITIQDAPSATITALPTTACSFPVNVTFSGVTTGATSWAWDFGDSQKGTTQNATHQYTQEGTFNVMLAASNAAGCTANAYTTITVQKPGLAPLALPREGCVPLTSKFSPGVTSADPVTSYAWNFGDGTTSTDPSPEHIFTTEGNFTVTLTITTRSGCTQTAQIPVRAGTPVKVDFTVDKTSGCQPDEFHFTNKSVPAGTEWEWIFDETAPVGDGSATSENPTYVWNSAGKHDVTLIVTNNGCTQQETISEMITIAAPVARFTAPRPDCINNKHLQFTDESDWGLSPSKNWHWDFGDGQTSNLENPAHDYAQDGTYNVTLTVDNGSCSSTITRQVVIISENPVIYADITNLCKGGRVNFGLNPLTGLAHFTDFMWVFGDGSTTNAQGNGAFHNYTTESNAPREAYLLLTDIYGCQHKSNVIQITVNGATAAFSIATKQCKNVPISFTDNSTTKTGNTIVSWTWDFGDGSPLENYTTKPTNVTHTYTAINKYNVTLTVKDNTGCENSITNSVNIANLLAAFGGPSNIACLNTPFQFSNSSISGTLTYEWDFGDGGKSTDATPAHTYTVPGKYTVGLKIQGNTGCRDSMTTTDFLRVPNPVADFTLPSVAADVCPPIQLTFTNNSTDYVSSAWEFGDNGTSTEQDPTHNYIRPGTFNVTLVVYSEGGCKSNVAGPKSISIAGPDGTFSVTPEKGCDPLSVTMNAVTTAAIKYLWDFGDGHTVTTTTPTSPTYTYPQEGVYYPVVLLEDNRGCRVAALGDAKVVADKVKANFMADVSKACDGGIVSFTDQSTSISADMGEAMTYAWDFGITGRTDDVGTGATPTFEYTAPGTYNVTLTTTSIYGCTNVATLPITVEPLPGTSVDAVDPLCVGSTVQLTGRDTKNIPATKWTWVIEGQTYNTQTPPATIFNQSGDRPVSLTISTASGMCSATDTKMVKIVDYPALRPDPASTSICLGNSVTLNLNANQQDIDVTWTNYKIDNIHSTSPVVSPDIDTTYHVRVENTTGCVTEADVKVEVSQPFTVTTYDTAMCKGQAVQLHAGGAVTYQWTPATGLNNPNAQNPLATPEATTTYHVIGYGKDNCFTSEADAVVTVYPLPVINAGADMTLPVGTVIEIPATGSDDIVKVEWWPVNYLNCVDCLTPTTSPKTSINYTVTATNNYGCKALDEINIKMVCESGVTWLPNTFTPNNDGQNDIFYVRGKGIKTIKSFRIYNRWGQLVFERSNFGVEDPTSGWDGKVNGVAVNPDVFVYVAEMVCDTNEDFTLKGNVMLLR